MPLSCGIALCATFPAMAPKQIATQTQLETQTPTEHITLHRDGSLWAKGQMLDGQQTGYWEWFRKDGTKMRSGTFEQGQQVGEWTTYDKNGAVYKVTTFKPREKR
jgi:antitoxin component YwqK of YwqJK toxin-antitoxin module